MSPFDNARRSLRQKLIDNRRAEAAHQTLDCAAHMILYLDEPAMVQRIGLTHLIERLNACRADIGLGSPDQPSHTPTLVLGPMASAGPDCQPPNGLPNRHPALQIVWRSETPVSLDIRKDPILGSLRARTLSQGVRAKLAQRLTDNARIVGMLCLDDDNPNRIWSADDQSYLFTFATSYFSPILCASFSLQSPAEAERLTEAELSVVRLAVKGLTYKEVGRKLGKSPNTVDNQLRRIRAKLNVTNRVELANACAGWL